MQLILIILAAFGVGYWFSSSNADKSLSKTASGLRDRLSRKSKSDTQDNNEKQNSIEAD